MKRSLLIVIALSLIFTLQSNSQGILKKVTGAMKDELLGTNKSGNLKNQQPEPPSACSDAVLIMDMGKDKLEYSEVTICSKDDGSLLFQNRMTGDYYVASGGVSKGPYRPGDPQIAGYSCDNSQSQKIEDLLIRYREYLSKTGDKYLITFAGKKYGPYAMINQFGVTRSKDKFAALVTETIIATEDEGKKIEQAINNAKTDQEKMELAMQYSQMMQQKMMQGGGPGSILPKLITNIPGDLFNPATGAVFNTEMKYDDILVSAYDKILDIHGNTVMQVQPGAALAGKAFVNTSNTRYAVYNYGTLTFSDNKTITDLFNPMLVKSDGKIFLAYMYYSPKRNAIMQCKIPF